MATIDRCIERLKSELNDGGIKATIARSRGMKPEVLYVYCERLKDVDRVRSTVLGRSVITKYTGKFRPAKETP